MKSVSTQAAAKLRPDFYHFAPDPRRALGLNRAMRTGLAGSVNYVARVLQSETGRRDPQLKVFLTQARHQPVSPLAFCHYHDLVMAVEQGDLASADRLLSRLLRLTPPAGGPQIKNLPDPARSPAGRLYSRFIAADGTADFPIFPPTRPLAASARRQIRAAFALMDQADPALAGEIRALISEIILAIGTDDKSQMTFDGASAFMLWGGILINARRKDGPVGMVQMLAHESAHVLLYGFCAAGPLVENDPNARYPSPLRRDRRPMEGIYHATFVLARMHRAVHQLLSANILTGNDLDRAKRDLEDNARLFAKGYAVVQRYGRLTPMGRKLMQGAYGHMKKHL